jgi:hypothetical protein
MSGGLGHLTYQSEQIILNVLEYLLPILVNHLVNLIQMTINFLFVYVFYYLFFLLCVRTDAITILFCVS